MTTTLQAQTLTILDLILGYSSQTPSPKYPADQKRSCAQIERAAAAARRQMGFDPEEPLPSMALFERLSRLRTGPKGKTPVVYAVEVLRAGVEGESSYDKERDEFLVTLSPATYSGLERNDPRSRNTASHEVGHVTQHWAELIRLSRIPHRADALQRGTYAVLRAYEDAEWQAREFAGALLAPARALWTFECRGYFLTPEFVQRTFEVSRACAEKRLRTYERKKEALVR
jgi:IrrE N-terminal-like domain